MGDEPTPFWPAGVAPFVGYAAEYDRWFEEHPEIYAAEVSALQRWLPASGRGIDIGAGTGRFALPCRAELAVEPAPPMAAMARQRGLRVLEAYGDALPVATASFDYALLVTVLALARPAERVLDEAFRVVRPGGWVVLAEIDPLTTWGALLAARQHRSRFLADACLRGADEWRAWLGERGATVVHACQTLLGTDAQAPGFLRVLEGSGQGAFVVLAAQRP